MEKNAPDISVVVPVYGCDATLEPLYHRVKDAISSIPATFEIIYVDDCGPGRPWEIISGLSQADSRVKGVKLAKNFGQHSAIMAGMEATAGRWVVIMDCDLQDQPEEICRFYNKAIEGYEAVIGRRVNRQDNIFKRVNSLWFNRFFSFMTDQMSDECQSSFGIYSRTIVDIIKAIPEQPLIFPLLVRWVGFKTTTIDVSHGKRNVGKSSYTLRRQIGLAANLMFSYSTKPLRLCIDLGFIMAFISFSYGIWLVFKYFAYHQVVEGWTSIMVSLYFLSGLILSAIGVQGIYIGKIFNNMKQRPLYIIQEKTSDVSQ